ncbi:ABC transporter substrate-binding protein [Chloroflexota bacterium]
MKRLLLMLIITGLLIAGCDSGGNTPEATATLEPTIAPTPTYEPIKITIGNLTDMTGVSANALAFIDMSMEDVIKHYNETGLIPGIELEMISYDTQYNPARFISGYEWLQEKGADVIWNALPPGVPTLKSRADEDKFPIFSATANVDPEELDGSYVFCLAVSPEYEAYTLLKWIAENDPDFPNDRPALIGGAAWNDAYSNIWFKAAEDYCTSHPDQYEWEKGYLTDMKFTWVTEVEGLKDCDYAYVPTPPQNFMEEYRDAGYAAKFLGTEMHAAFNGMIDKAGLWDDIDGMLFILSGTWYNEENLMMNLCNRLLDVEHSERKAEEIRTSGSGYRSTARAYMVCDIIRDTVRRVGAENFCTEALVETAKSWSFTYDGVEDFVNFSETKRFGQDYYAIYRVEVDPTNPHSWQYITRADPDWLFQVTEP